jgi:tetratricopeptide (TPR) repeat protein
MVVRYQAPLRHEIEEWLQHRGQGDFAAAGGWALLLLPLVVWIGAGWIAVWWTIVTFRFMRRRERVVALALLIATAFAVPGYRLAVGLYGLATDPKVKTTTAAAAGAYEPDRIVKLQELVATYPDDPTYRFLLAGLYKNGRFFEEAFEEYGRVLELAPETWQARVNIGNIYFQTGQYAEATAQYGRAIEMRPRDVLAYCNMYLAQTESFRLNEATATFEKARAIDAGAVARVLEAGTQRRNRPMVVDATIDLGAIWKAALEGRELEDWLAGEPGGEPAWKALLNGLGNPLSALALLSALACGLIAFLTRARPPAGRCTRCGRPYCAYCKSSGDAHAYCSQCVHLFVLQDGLALETKTRKLYEVETYARRSRLVRRLLSLVLPGSGLVLRGGALLGTALLLAWLTAVTVIAPAAVWPVEGLLGLDLRLDVLRTGPVPGLLDLDPILLLAVPLALTVWIAGSAWLRRPSEA